MKSHGRAAVNGTRPFLLCFCIAKKARSAVPDIGRAPRAFCRRIFLVRPGPWWQPWARALRRPAPPVPKGGEVRHLTRRIRRNGGTSRPPFSADNKKAVSLSKKDTATAHGPFRGNCTLLKREEVSCAPYAGRYSDSGVLTRSPPSQSSRPSGRLGTTSPIQQRLCAGFSPGFPL